MRAVQFTTFGGPAALRLVDAPQPVPAAGEVRVRVVAAGVNPVDIAVSEGQLQPMMPLTLPVTAGSELAGVIDALGAGVDGYAPGDAVHGVTGISGAFAEYAIVKVAALARKPAAMSFEEAAGLPIAAATATAALEAGAVGPGTRLFIHAAAGGVGTIAVQMAKARGAHVIAAASAGNIAFVRALGADEVVDRATPYETSIRDVDVVLDAFGPEAQARSWGLLRRGGVLLSLVTPPSAALAAEHGVRAQKVFGTPTARVLAAADALVAAGQLKVWIARRYRLEQVPEALAQLATGQVRGKLVLGIADA